MAVTIYIYICMRKTQLHWLEVLMDNLLPWDIHSHKNSEMKQNQNNLSIQSFLKKEKYEINLAI